MIPTGNCIWLCRHFSSRSERGHGVWYSGTKPSGASSTFRARLVDADLSRRCGADWSLHFQYVTLESLPLLQRRTLGAIAFLSPARSTLVEKTGGLDIHKDRGAVHVGRNVAARKGSTA